MNKKTISIIPKANPIQHHLRLFLSFACVSPKIPLIIASGAKKSGKMNKPMIAEINDATANVFFFVGCSELAIERIWARFLTKVSVFGMCLAG
jgi:hypothetical protein